MKKIVLLLSLVSAAFMSQASVDTAIIQAPGFGGNIDLTAGSYITWGYDADSLLETVHELVRQSRKLDTALDELAEAMHRIALIHAAPGFRDPERADWDSLVELAGRISPEDAQLFYQIAVTGCRDLELAPDPRTGLEMTLLRMLAFKPADGKEPTPRPGPAEGGSDGDKEAARKSSPF